MRHWHCAEGSEGHELASTRLVAKGLQSPGTHRRSEDAAEMPTRDPVASATGIGRCGCPPGGWGRQAELSRMFLHQMLLFGRVAGRPARLGIFAACPKCHQGNANKGLFCDIGKASVS